MRINQYTFNIKSSKLINKPLKKLCKRDYFLLRIPYMMTHNPTADFPRVRIKNTFRVKMCFVQIVMIVFEMWKSEWSGMCDLKKVLVKVVWPCDSFLILLWLCAVVVILRTIYITRKNEQRKAADDARCEKSGWVK